MYKMTQTAAATRVTGTEFFTRIDEGINRTNQTGRPFLVIMIQLANLQAFKEQRPTHVVNALMREMLTLARKSIHTTQYVGVIGDGLGFVFEGVEVGQADILTRKLVMIAEHVIKTGKYNDLSSRWTEIIYQFLWPNKPGILYPTAGWAIYPRDGATARSIANRALAHVAELRR